MQVRYNAADQTNSSSPPPWPFWLKFRLKAMPSSSRVRSKTPEEDPLPPSTLCLSDLIVDCSNMSSDIGSEQYYIRICVPEGAGLGSGTRGRAGGVTGPVKINKFTAGPGGEGYVGSVISLAWPSHAPPRSAIPPRG